MYEINVLPEALKDFTEIDKSIAKRITDKLSWFSVNLEVISHISLKGEFSGLFKFRVGDWRVIYDIDHDLKVIHIHRVGHRKDIYR